MKIDRPAHHAMGPATLHRGSGSEAVGRPASPEATRDVRVSDPAALAALGAPIDEARVSELRTAVAEGRYVLDPAKLAQRIVALDLEHKP